MSPTFPSFGTDNGPTCPVCGTSTCYFYSVDDEESRVEVICIGCRATSAFRPYARPTTGVEARKAHEAAQPVKEAP